MGAEEWRELDGAWSPNWQSAHEQIVVNGTVDRTVHEGFGEVRQARPAARFERTPAATGTRAPQLGEHSAAILEELGYDEAGRTALLEAGAVGSPPA